MIRSAKSLIKLGVEPCHGVCVLGFNAPEWHISNLAGIVVSVCVCVCVCACVRACVCAYVRACVRACIVPWVVPVGPLYVVCIYKSLLCLQVTLQRYIRRYICTYM